MGSLDEHSESNGRFLSWPQESEFKERNQRQWEANSSYWLTEPLRQVEDTKIFFKRKLRLLVQPNMHIVDMGCGSAWLLDFLFELGTPFSYVGLDFTPAFVSHLQAKFATAGNVSFRLCDVEATLPNDLHGTADLVFNCFSFFECLNLHAAFANAANMLKKRGRLVVFTIDPTYLILAISKDMHTFRENLATYEDMKARGEIPHFFQKIDLGNAESESLKYASVLYSFADYFALSIKASMRLDDYGEVIKTSKFLPKIYQYMVFTA